MKYLYILISVICIIIIIISIQHKVYINIPEYYSSINDINIIKNETNIQNIKELNNITIPQEFYIISQELPIYHYAKENDISFFINILNTQKNDINIDISKEYSGDIPDNILYNINNYLINSLNNYLSSNEIFKYQNIYSTIKKIWIIENNLTEKFSTTISTPNDVDIQSIYIQNKDFVYSLDNSSNNQQHILVSKQYIQSSNSTEEINNNYAINNQFIKNTLAASMTQDYTQFVPTNNQDFSQFLQSSNNDFAVYYKSSNLNQLFNNTLSNDNKNSELLNENSTESNNYNKYVLTSSNNYKVKNQDYIQTLSNNYSNQDYLSYSLNTKYYITNEKLPIIINQEYKINENFINFMDLNNFNNKILSIDDNINKYTSSENVIYNNNILGILSEHLIYRDTKSYGLNISLLTIHNLNSNIILKDFNINGHVFEDKINNYKPANLINNDHYQIYGKDYIKERNINYEKNLVCQHYRELSARGIFENTTEFDCQSID